MIAQAQDPADRALAAEIAATLSERGLGGASADLVERIERLRADRSPRAEAMKRQAARWSGAAGRAAPAADAGRILARADWRRIARARADEPGAFLMAGGRAARLDPADPLAANEWLAVAETTGGRAGARILLAARLSASDALSSAGVETVERTDFDWDAATLRARRIRRLGAISLSESPLPAPKGPKAAEALCAALRAAGLARLPAAPAIDETLARLALARAYGGAEIPEWSEAGLLETLEEWLAPLLGDPPALDKPRPPDVREALLARLDWPARRAVESLAPLTFQSPAGRALAIDYLAEGGPRVEARVQEFYGLAAHPAIAGGRAPLTLSLLSPARRQIAVTRDIVAFWRGGYRDMAKDMRGRYPKHDWPDDPAAARPHEGRTKARL
jgi:ATP-dependent helicase HrpB